MDNNVLTAVPLFLFMGYLVERAGIVAKLFYAIRLASYRLPGSIVVAALVTSATSTNVSQNAKAAAAGPVRLAAPYLVPIFANPFSITS